MIEQAEGLDQRTDAAEEARRRTGDANYDGDRLADAFDEAAPRYDVMVALNPGYHAELRSAARGLLERIDAPEARVLDLGCGSGASTRALVRARSGRRLRVLGVDASAGMLRAARRKSWPSGVEFAQGFAQDVAVDRARLGLAEPVDGVLAAYLFRNVAERDETLEAVREVLRPGGTLVVQEYSVAGSAPARLIWSAVCWLVVVPLSMVLRTETNLYRYLWRSVLAFDSVDAFTDRLHRAGFVDVQRRTAGGWQHGILHTFRARKPVE